MWCDLSVCKHWSCLSHDSTSVMFAQGSRQEERLIGDLHPSEIAARSQVGCLGVSNDSRYLLWGNQIPPWMSQVQKFNMRADFLCNYSIHSQETAARQLIKECIPNCYQFEISSKLKQSVFLSVFPRYHFARRMDVFFISVYYIHFWMDGNIGYFSKYVPTRF